MSTLETVYRELEAIFRAALTDPYPNGLGRVHRLLDRLGSPHAAFPSVIVTGSKGKGSTATFLAESGRRKTEGGDLRLADSVLSPQSSVLPFPLLPSIGLFTGPHLHTYRERIKLNGVDIGPADFIALFEEVMAAIKSDPAGTFISRFEIITVMALLYFARAKVDLAVLEVGLGGRFDAVNVARDMRLAVFTPIEMEHVRNLGPTIADIVYHKSGIMRQDGPAITARQSPSVTALLGKAAVQLNVSLHPASEFWRYQENSLSLHHDNGHLWQEFEAINPDGQTQLLRTGLPGTFQVENALTALAAGHLLAEMGLLPAPDPQALQSATIPGRLEAVGQAPTIIIDGAHTPNAMRELVRSLVLLEGKPVWVLAFLGDKAVPEMLRLLPLKGHSVILTELHSHPKRRAKAEEVKALLTQNPARLEIRPDLGEAIAIARQIAHETPGGYVCITGSLYLAAEARAALGLLDAATAAEAVLIQSIELG